MSNVVDIDVFRKKKERLASLKLNEPPIIKATKSVAAESITFNDRTESLFLREVRKFKLIRMPNHIAFVIMKTETLPPAFPPYNPSPLVA